MVVEIAPWVLLCLEACTISAVVLGTGAFACETRRQIRGFLAFAGSVWVLSAYLIQFVDAPIFSNQPLWRHVLSNFISVSPLVVVPTGLLLYVVSGELGRRWIPVLALAGALGALPFTFLSSIVATCYINHDCL